MKSLSYNLFRNNKRNNRVLPHLSIPINIISSIYLLILLVKNSYCRESN